MAIAPLPTPLASRLATLPLVLAGPFLRLVQPDQVVVWIALQKSASLTLKVLDANKQTLFTGTANTIKVGNSLHLALVVARSTGSQSPLSVGTVYYYDISFGSAGSGLDAAGVLGTATELSDCCKKGSWRTTC
jgi:hypothetical protein